MAIAKVAVIGAGVIGLSTAYCLKSADPSVDVTILAKSCSPETCSDVAAGIWEPFILRDTPMELQRKWSKATWDKTEELLKRKDAQKLGISMCSGFNLYDYEIKEPPEWSDLVTALRMLTKEELKKYPPKYKSGFFFTTYIIEGSKYLSWLQECFMNLGGKMETKNIDSFEEVAEYDVVINCTGFGSRKLCNDMTIEPIRGQVMRVKAPWVRHFYLGDLEKEKKVSYIIPNNDWIVLGGTAQMGNFSLDISDEDREHIIRETQLIQPDLEGCEKIKDCVGLRPSRPSVRLEREDFILKNNQNKRSLKIIHNYGHGGAGITIHWGCALDAVELAKYSLNEIQVHKSKL